MAVFSKIYDKTLEWAAHRHASKYLAAVSFAESSFFPIPPDVMLAPMTLAKPINAYRFAFIATVASVIGGVAGYCLGYFAYEPMVVPFIQAFGYEAAYAKALAWFESSGFWLICLAGFITPIPYKLFTIGAGVMQYDLALFCLGSIIGRASRFYIVTAVVRAGGERLQKFLRKIADGLGWAVVIAIITGVVAKKLIWIS